MISGNHPKGASQRNQCILFSLRHPKYFIDLISYKYPLQKYQLIKYKDILNWPLVSENIAINWTYDLISSSKNNICWDDFTVNKSAFKDFTLLDSFSDMINWNNETNASTIAKNEGLPWTIDFIEKYKSKLDFYELSSNKGVKWSDQLIEKFNEHWALENLGQNESIPWTLELFDKYLSEQFFEYTFIQYNRTINSDVEIIEKYKKSMNWLLICSNPNLPWKELGLLQRWSDRLNWRGISRNKWFFENDSLFFKNNFDKWSSNNFEYFWDLSSNEGLDWTKYFIEEYKQLWVWEDLCTNESVPWDSHLVEFFYDRIKWGGLIDSPLLDERDIEIAPTGGFSQAEGLILNPNVDWTIDFLEKFERNLEFEILRYNKGVWERVFKPVVDDWFVDVVLRII